MVEIVNIVGSDRIEKNLDLTSLSSDIGFPIAKYDPEMYPGMYIQFDDDGPMVTVYSSGSYIIVGSNTFTQLEEMNNHFLDLLVEQGRLPKPSESFFKVQNIVGSADLDQELDLSELLLALGLEEAEYNPEQFPGIIYRDQENNCVTLIFRTGKVVITGATMRKSIEQSYQKIESILKNDE